MGRPGDLMPGYWSQGRFAAQLDGVKPEVSGGQGRDEAASPVQSFAARRVSGYDKRSLRVLVIDDDEIARQMACDILEGAGHKTFQLGSAMGATQMVFREDIEAVVLDVMMPTIGGDKLAQLLRAHSKGESLWIVLISSIGSAALSRIGREVRANAVVRKDAIRTELLEAMVKCRPVSAPPKGY